MKMPLMIVDEQILLHLFHYVRKAQGKLHQVKGGRELIDELEWAMKQIELTTYTRGNELLSDLMIQEGLTPISDVEEANAKLRQIEAILHPKS